ncbi:MAG: CaiB/BaiF CoA transferase family protein [Gammaproteobacteria bacterium]
MSAPLENIKVLDLTHMLAGPYASMLIADLGAEVVKVEPPGKGEITRGLYKNHPDYSLDGVSPYHITLARNKKSLTLDLKQEKGKKLFYELVKSFDVVLDNFSSGVTERLGIDFSTLKQHNPKIITCSISGFGKGEADRPAYDQILQAYGGGMSITGEDENHPVRAGIPIADLSSGMFSIIGILTALHKRDKDGVGDHVDISMLDCQVSLLTYMATMNTISGIDPKPIGNQHFLHVPYNSYKTADGFIIISVVHEDFWPNLLDALNLEEFKGEEYKTVQGRLVNRKNIDEAISEKLKHKPSSHWLDLLAKHRVPSGPINSVRDALEDPLVKKRNMIVDLKQPSGSIAKMPGNPIKLDSYEENYSPAPELGEHTAEILEKYLKISPEELDSLKSEKII